MFIKKKTHDTPAEAKMDFYLRFTLKCTTLETNGAVLIFTDGIDHVTSFSSRDSCRESMTKPKGELRAEVQQIYQIFDIFFTKSINASTREVVAIRNDGSKR